MYSSGYYDTLLNSLRTKVNWHLCHSKHSCSVGTTNTVGVAGIFVDTLNVTDYKLNDLQTPKTPVVWFLKPHIKLIYEP